MLGTGSNVMEELRRAAMARVKQAAAKPQAVSMVFTCSCGIHVT